MERTGNRSDDRQGPGLRRTLVAGSVGALLVAAMGVMTGCATAVDTPSSVEPAVSEVESVFGIRPESLRLSAAGSMLDFRYRVVDAEKAAPLLNGKFQPYLYDESHQARLGVPDTPVLGRIRQTARNNKILTNRSYFVMFGNPGKAVKSGDKVTLLLGDMKITDLKVQ